MTKPEQKARTRPWWVVWAQAGGLLMVALLVLSPVLPGLSGMVSRLENALYDWRINFTASPELPEDLPPVVVVGLDEASREVFPESRTAEGKRLFMARVLRRLAELEVNLVGIDLFWHEAGVESSDAELEAALLEADAVLATDMVNDLYPIDRFRQNEVSEGFVNLVEDPRDGVVRDVLMWQHKDLSGKLIELPMSLEMASLYWFPEEPPALAAEAGGLRLGDRLLPHYQSRLRPRFNGPPVTVVPVSTLFEPGHEDTLRGALVLVGTTSRLDKDEFLSPLTPPSQEGLVRTKSIFGVELHAWTLRAILAGDLIRVPADPWTTIWSLAWVILFWIPGFVISPRPWLHTAVWVVAGTGLVIGNVLAFSAGLWLPLGVPLLALGILGTGGLLYRRAKDVWEKHQVEDMFGHYLSPNLVERLLDNPELIKLGGRRRTLTILFSDLRGFTSMSEQLDPSTVSDMLNEYFTEMVDILFAHGGTLDKFMGDAIMAFFGDPVPQEDHARRAVQTAVDMQLKLVELRRKFESEGKPHIWAGIGINTGDVVVGNQGGEANFDYTVIGDAVNLASRLESKAPKNQVMVSRAAYEALGQYREEFQWEKLEPIMVKGKAEPVEVFLVRIPGLDYNDEA